ncbi:MAG: hypothetical protein J6R47_06960 [Acholeplasmatales bacterium]|nr:hypothetical protein [Acholeplasmatales bacterium]
MQKNKLIDKLFLIIVSIQTILMGILFIVQILRIYYGNNKTFTWEICGEYLLQILPVIIIWILVIVAAFIYFYIKGNPTKDIAKITNLTKLNNLERICPEFINENLGNEYTLLNKEKKNRKVALIVNIVISVICSIMGLCYLLNVKHFESSGNLTEQSIKMGIHLLPWCIIAFGCFIGYVFYVEYSAKKSIEAIKAIIKSDGKKVYTPMENRKEKLVVNILRGAIGLIAVALIIVGIFNGGAEDVLQKAINICTECIGLG